MTRVVNLDPSATGIGNTAAHARSSAEAEVLTLYHTLLGRAPGDAERDGWVDAMLAGMTLDTVRAAFLRSEEYQDRARTETLSSRITASGLFDAAWYKTHHPDVAAAGQDPLMHYCRFGRLEDRPPNAWFRPAWYRAQSGLPPGAGPDLLLDYADRGEAAGLTPGPDFEPTWYRDAHGLPADASPLAHFLRNRCNGGVAPCPRLWSVGQAPPQGQSEPAHDPFQRWLENSPDPVIAAAPDIATLSDAGVFDANHYCMVNVDVFESDLDPLAHFCAFGWHEGRNPSFYFDTDWYLATNPEVKRLRLNPLAHYALVGEAAERRPVVYFEPGWYRRTYGVPAGTSALAHYLANRHSGTVSPNALFDPIWYRTHCGQLLHHRRDPFAHYLVAGMQRDLQPSAGFDAAAWRARTRGRRSRHFSRTLSAERDNPLVDYLLSQYR